MAQLSQKYSVYKVESNKSVTPRA